MIVRNAILNPIIPTKTYVLLTYDWRVLGECHGDNAGQAFSEGRAVYGPAVRTACLKSEYERLRDKNSAA